MFGFRIPRLARILLATAMICSFFLLVITGFQISDIGTELQTEGTGTVLLSIAGTSFAIACTIIAVCNNPPDDDDG